MKKLISVFCVVIIMMSCLAVTVFAAAPSSSLSLSTSSIRTGDSVTVTAKVSNCSSKSLGIELSYDKSVFDLVSGDWLVSGSVMSDFSDGCAVIAYSNAYSFSGNVFKFTLKTKSNAKIGKQTITCEVQAEGYSAVNPSATITIACKSHSYGAWSRVDDNRHKRTCSSCGYEETVNHTWNSGTVTKEATCKANGTKTVTCTVCNATKTQTIAKTNNHKFGSYVTEKSPTCVATGIQKRTCTVCGKTESKTVAALGHNFTNPTITKQPTCTTSGLQSGKCTRCGSTTSQTIKPTGHNFGGWTTTKSATCTAKGEQKRVCAKCKTEEKRETAALGHDFESPKTVKEATIYSTGLIEGKCKRCGQATTQIIPCQAKDEKTGILFEAAEGVFANGTQLVVNELTAEDENYQTVKSALSDISDRFVIYDITAKSSEDKVQANGTFKVTFARPKGYGDETEIYYIDQDGIAQKLESEANDDEITVTAPSLGRFCVVDTNKNVDESDPLQTTSQQLLQLPLYVYIISGVALLSIIALIIIICLKRKKKQ